MVSKARNISIPHPFTLLPEPYRVRVFLALLSLTLFATGVMAWASKPLKTSVAPLGILSFEFAGDLERARAIVDSWGPEAKLYAALGLGLDYLYLVLYASTLGLACALVAERLKVFPAMGISLAWAQVAAALLDAVENLGLIQVLLGSTGELWPVIAWWCALGKFACVVSGMLYVLISLLTWRMQRASARTA